MTSVLVLGTGHIGFNVCKEFKREGGYKVYGLSNDETVRNKLVKNEIIPVITDILKDDNTWIELVITESIDVIIECVSTRSPKIIQDSIIKLKKLKPEIFIIYTSGSFTFGGDSMIVDEKSNRKGASHHHHFETLIQIEKIYHSIDAIVVIPTMIYGLNASYTGYYFHCVKHSLSTPQLNDKKHIVKAYGFNDDGFYQGFIHIYDLSRIYLLIVQNLFKFKQGQSIIANSYTERCDDLLKAICKLEDKLKDKDIEIKFIKPSLDTSNSDTFATGMSFNQRFSNQKAVNLLSFHPQQPSFIDSLEIYYKSWNLKKHTTIDDFLISEIPK